MDYLVLVQVIAIASVFFAVFTLSAFDDKLFNLGMIIMFGWVAFIVYQYLKWKNDLLIITNNRIVKTKGIIFKSFVMYDLDKLEGIEVKNKYWYQNLIIRGIGGNDTLYRYLPVKIDFYSHIKN